MTLLRANPAEAAQVTLLDVVDIALTKGVVIQGDATISVADVDLVFLGLRLVLASVDTLEPDSFPTASPGRGDPYPDVGRGGCANSASVLAPTAEPAAQQAAPVQPAEKPEVPGESGKQLADPERAEKGLARLVLTVVELLRQLLEKQALRRMERGSLTAEQTERMGQTFQRLEKKMEQLKALFELDGEDLNLNLGPLGNLI